VRVAVRLVAIALLCIGTIGSLVGADRRPAAAQASNGIFALSARADGLGLEFVATGLPVVPQGKLAFISPASAQATLDQFSGAAFASAPYAGDLIVSMPTTINGLGAGTLPPFPAYPFYVATDSATPDARQEAGPYVLAAHSEPNDSNAQARVGLSTTSPEVVSVTSDAAVHRDPATGLLVAEAVTTTAPTRINDLLSLGEITSTARFSYDPSTPDVPPAKESSLAVGTITVAGLPFGLTDQGLVAAGNPLLPVDLGAITSLLAGSGVEVELLPAEETATAISSSAVQITYTEQLPPPFLDTTVRLILGRSSAALTTGTLPSRPTPTTRPASPAPAPAAAPTGGGSVPIATPSVPVAAPVAPVAAPVAAPAAAVPTAAAQSIAAPLADLHLFYLVLAGSALLAITSSRLVQWLTFRLKLAAAS
jgi:hypothetical protein